MKKILFAVMILLLSPPVYAGVNPTSAFMKLSKVYFSTSGDCSSPVLAYDAQTDATSPESTEVAGTTIYYDYKDMAASPTFGEHSIADGTYLCMITYMSSVITITPAENEGSACVAGVETSLDTCYPQEGYAPSYTDLDGDVTACTTSEDWVYVYISRWSAATEGSGTTNAWAPPTEDGDAVNGFNLTSNIVVDANGTGVFTFGCNGKVETQTRSDSETICGMEPPSFGFTYTE